MASNQEEMEILAMIGGTLIHLQHTEQAIRRCMTFVFQDGSGVTLEQLETQQKAERKKPLGYFLTKLRERTELQADFDEMLTDFLDCRNQFVHKIEDVSGWNVETAEGRKAARLFISRVFNLSHRICLTFSGFLRAWVKQVGLNVPTPPGAEEFFKEFDRVYTPLINHLVFKKEK